MGRIKLKPKTTKGIPKIKLKKLGRPFAKDVKAASKLGKKIANQKIGPGIRRKSKRRKRR